jgi:hypothetical protein
MESTHMTESSRTSRSNADTSTRRVRVTLRYIEILDSKDIDTVGEFRFRFRAGVPERDDVVESRIPEDEHAHLSISEHPARNRVSLGTVLFEGDVGPGDSLLVEADGEEVDRFTPNDPITPYRRVFAAPINAALGEHGPWDEGIAGEGDPEQLSDWRFAYVIEAVGGQVRPAT